MQNEMFIDPEKPWLGGFKTGPIGDEATYFPDLWTWIIKDLGVKSVVDVGCGSGVSVKFFETLLPFGDVLGIDGVPQEHPSIVEHDYTLGPFQIDRAYDLVWCCEFVEHVAEEFVPNFLETFKCAKQVFMTHADPRQQGWNHINCRVAEYWRGVMSAIGYRFDEDLTRDAKSLARKNKSQWNHFCRSGMVFLRA